MSNDCNCVSLLIIWLILRWYLCQHETCLLLVIWFSSVRSRLKCVWYLQTPGDTGYYCGWHPGSILSMSHKLFMCVVFGANKLNTSSFLDVSLDPSHFLYALLHCHVLLRSPWSSSSEDFCLLDRLFTHIIWSGLKDSKTQSGLQSKLLAFM